LTRNIILKFKLKIIVRILDRLLVAKLACRSSNISILARQCGDEGGRDRGRGGEVANMDFRGAERLRPM